MPLNQQPPQDYRLIRAEDEQQKKGLEDVATLKKLLESRGRNDLAILLEGCTSEVEESSQYGSYTFSVISTFWIYVPPEKIEKVEQISEEDKELLLELVRKIYPPKEYSPEIREIQSRVLTKNIKEREDKNKQQIKPSQNKKTYIKGKNETFLQKYLVQIIIGIIITVAGGIILRLILE